MARLPWSIARAHAERGFGSAVARPRRGRRSWYVVGLVVLGYWLAEQTRIDLDLRLLIAVAAGACAIAALARGWIARVMLGSAVVLLAGAWYTVRIVEQPVGGLASIIQDERVDTDSGETIITRVRGVIRDVPRRIEFGEGTLAAFGNAPLQTGFALGVTDVGPVRGSGGVRVRVECSPASLPEFVRPGAFITISGRLRPIGGGMNPGEPDWAALARQDGVIAVMEVPDPTLATASAPVSMGERLVGWWYAAIGAARARCLAVLEGDADRPSPSRALLSAMLLGERDRALDEVNAAFTRLGLLHLIAISGFNLAVMAGVVMVLLRLTGDRGWIEPVIIAMLVLGYMLLLPAQAPILRAGAIVLVLLMADACGRRYDRATILGWVACGVLIARPLDAWSMGFQLSFGIVAALLVLGDTMHERLWGVPIRGLGVRVPRRGPPVVAWIPPAMQWCWRALQAQISATILAWGVSLPILAAGTGEISVLAPLATLVVLPLTVLLLWAGYVVLLLAIAAPFFAEPAAWALDACSGLLVGVVMGLDSAATGFVRLPLLSPLWAACCGVVLVVGASRLSVRDPRLLASLGILAAWLAAQMLLLPRPQKDALLRIDALCVGQGSCHLLRSGTDALLVDCGSTDTAIGLRRVPQALAHLGVRSVPTMIVTGPGVDRLSGVADAAARLRTREVIVPSDLLHIAEMHPQSPAGQTLAVLARRQVRITPARAGDRLDIGGLRAVVLHEHSGAIAVRVERGSADGGSVAAVFPGSLRPEALASGVLRASGRADVVVLPITRDEGAASAIADLDPVVAILSSSRRFADAQDWVQWLPRTLVRSTAVHGAVSVELLRDGRIVAGTMRSTADRGESIPPSR